MQSIHCYSKIRSIFCPLKIKIKFQMVNQIIGNPPVKVREQGFPLLGNIFHRIAIFDPMSVPVLSTPSNPITAGHRILSPVDWRQNWGLL